MHYALCSSALGASCSALLRYAAPRHPHAQQHQHNATLQLRRVRCRAQTSTEEPATSSEAHNGAGSPPAGSPPQPQPPASTSSSAGSPRLQRTLTDLDALLGLSDDASTTTPPAQQPAASEPAADAPRPAASGEPWKGGREDMEAQFRRIAERAKKLADESKAGRKVETEQQALRQEFESLLHSIGNSPTTLDKDDMKRLQEAAFGPQTYFVTETRQLAQADRMGLLVRGNLRDERAKVYQHICSKVTELFGDKYTVIMVEDEWAMLEGSSTSSAAAPGLGLGPSGAPRISGATRRAQELNTPRIAFQIIPSAQAIPPQTNGWKRAVAVALLLLVLGSCGQLALVANIAKLPRETLEWFANSANFESNQVPPGLETWDLLPYFATAAPIFGAVLGSNIMHEVGHRVAAFLRDVKLGPSYFIPNFTVGSFGAITPFTSLLKDRLQLWDVAAAGPLAGALFSLALLLVGLAQSQPGQLPAEALVPVPTPLFQGSLLLGGVMRLALGEAALRASEVPVSPLVIAGYCGLITQALQLLPVGSTDGGRMVQGAFGKGTLRLTSFFTYLGLGLGLLGSSLSLPYGLYVLVCLRTAERYVADNVTPADGPRASATLLALTLAVLVLVPMAPELSDSFGIGNAKDAF